MGWDLHIGDIFLLSVLIPVVEVLDNLLQYDSAIDTLAEAPRYKRKL